MNVQYCLEAALLPVQCCLSHCLSKREAALPAEAGSVKAGCLTVKAGSPYLPVQCCLSKREAELPCLPVEAGSRIACRIARAVLPEAKLPCLSKREAVF